MNQRVTRRRFGQLVLAGTTVAGLGYLANKTFAQTSNLTILGVRPNPITSNNPTANPKQNTNEVQSPTAGRIAFAATANTPRGLALQSLELTTNNFQNLATPQVPANTSTPILQSNEQVSGFTTLANGTRVIAITPVNGSKNQADPTRLTVLDTSTTTVNVSGLQRQEKLGALVGTNDGGLLGLVLQKNGRPPVRLVNVNVQTGAITANGTVNLPADQRFITLAQCPDGTLYTITVANNGTSSLVKLDQAQQKPIIVAQLSLNGRPWTSGLQNLVCTSAGQLLAFGAPRYIRPYNLYTVDSGTGAMSLLRQFDVANLTISRG